MSSTSLSSARTASLRVTQQEYEALQLEANRQGYKLSHLMRHRIFGKSTQCNNCRAYEPNHGKSGGILHQLDLIGRELGENGVHIRLIASNLDEGFRNAFGLDFCLRLLERLSHELLKALALVQGDVRKADNSGFTSEEQTS